MAQKTHTGLVFLKEEQIEEHVKNLEVKDRMFFIEKPKLATDESLKENGFIGRSFVNEEYKAYEYKWRFATKKEWNTAVKMNGGVFQTI